MHLVWACAFKKNEQNGHETYHLPQWFQEHDLLGKTELHSGKQFLSIGEKTKGGIVYGAALARTAKTSARKLYTNIL